MLRRCRGASVSFAEMWSILDKEKYFVAMYVHAPCRLYLHLRPPLPLRQLLLHRPFTKLMRVAHAPPTFVIQCRPNLEAPTRCKLACSIWS